MRILTYALCAKNTGFQVWCWWGTRGEVCGGNQIYSPNPISSCALSCLLSICASLQSVLHSMFWHKQRPLRPPTYCLPTTQRHLPHSHRSSVNRLSLRTRKHRPPGLKTNGRCWRGNYLHWCGSFRFENDSLSRR